MKDTSLRTAEIPESMHVHTSCCKKNKFESTPSHLSTSSSSETAHPKGPAFFENFVDSNKKEIVNII